LYARDGHIVNLRLSGCVFISVFLQNTFTDPRSEWPALPEEVQTDRPASNNSLSASYYLCLMCTCWRLNWLLGTWMWACLSGLGLGRLTWLSFNLSHEPHTCNGLFDRSGLALVFFGPYLLTQFQKTHAFWPVVLNWFRVRFGFGLGFSFGSGSDSVFGFGFGIGIGIGIGGFRPFRSFCRISISFAPSLLTVNDFGVVFLNNKFSDFDLKAVKEAPPSAPKEILLKNK